MVLPEGISDSAKIGIALGLCFGEHCDKEAVATWHNSRNEELPVCQKHLEWLLYCLSGKEVSPGVWVVIKEDS